MFELPVDVVHVDTPFLELDLASLGGDGRATRVVDSAGSVPGDVLVLVVFFTLDILVVGISQLALDDALCAGLGNLVIIHDLATAYNDQRPELAEDRAGRDDSYSPALVGVRDDIALDHVALLLVIDDDLVKALVFGEKEVRIAEADATGRFSRQHVKTFAATSDLERPTAIFTTTLQITELVDLGLTLGILGKGELIIDNIHHGAFLVH